MSWTPELVTPNPFCREALLERDFDPLFDTPEVMHAPLLDEDWGIWILRQRDGDRVRRSIGTSEWEEALNQISKRELAGSSFSETLKRLNDRNILELFRYVRAYHLVALDHLAAVRAILSPDGAWIWSVGICHDEILAQSGYDRLMARFRNQRLFMPRIEFEPSADMALALISLTDQGFELDDVVDIEGERFRALSIAEAFQRLGVDVK